MIAFVILLGSLTFSDAHLLERKVMEYKIAQKTLAPFPVYFTPLGEDGWTEVEIPEPKYQQINSHAGKLKSKGRTFIVIWSKEEQKLYMKEDKTKRTWWIIIWDWFKGL